MYGRTLDAYSAVQSLLSIGLPGSRICFVQPPLKYSITCFNNAQVETTVHQAMEAQGVQIYDGRVKQIHRRFILSSCILKDDVVV